MATQRVSAGLSMGQLFTLTLGFLAASVVIFALGWWAGYDSANQRIQRERRPIRLAVPPPEVIPTSPLVATVAVPTLAPRAAVLTTTPTVTPRLPSPTSTRPLVVERPLTPTPRVSGTLKETWAVQVTATTDALEAVMFARQLRQKGYDAYTVQGPVGGVTWYRVRVGRFPDRADAKATERRIKEREGIEAAYVVQQ